MKLIHLVAIGAIFAATSIGWRLLSEAVAVRTNAQNSKLCLNVEGNWGPPMVQQHPRIFYASPTNRKAMREIQPEASNVSVDLAYDRKKKGLLWYRTYRVDFHATYDVANPTPIRQTVYVEFTLPAKGTSYDDFQLRVGDRESTQRTPREGKITEAVHLEAGASMPVTIAYRSRGLDSWRYVFGENPRIRNFTLAMATNFAEIDFPHGTGSPNTRETTADGGWKLGWEYPDVIAANAIGMGMPSVLNPGPTVARITYFAPISLLFFFAVLVIVGMARGQNLHPMNYFFLAAGYFAFQLLLAYLVDVIPLFPAFFVSCVVSLGLVCGYVWAVAGRRFALITALAQTAYMVLFSYSFFFEGLSGLTITIGAVLTLALLMWMTAKVDWPKIFAQSVKPRRQVPPPVPQAG